MRPSLSTATVSSPKCNEVLSRDRNFWRDGESAKKYAIIACCHTRIIHLSSLTKKVILQGAASHADMGMGSE